MSVWPLVDGKVLVLRTCDRDGRSHGGFVWPLTVGATVEAPDWDPDPHRECGGGLHGLPWGCGDAGLLSTADDAVWMVVAVDPADIANPGQTHKVRFRAGTVHAIGTRGEMTALLVSHGTNLPIVYAVATAGYYGTATAGGYGTATAGYEGTATAGRGGTATAGHFGTATAGHFGTATAGHFGTATAGYEGTATAGRGGTATAGRGGTATAGDRGTAMAGVGGTVSVWWWDGGRRRLVTGYVGEDGIEADTPYRVVDGRLVEAAS